VACREEFERLHAYLDGELDAASAADFERHLQSCDDCAATVMSERALRASLERAQLYERAPATLRRALRSQIAPPGNATAAAMNWKWLAIAAMLLFAICSGFLAVNLWRTRGAGPDLAVAAVDAHLRSLQQGHLADVESTDQHTVKPWFNGRVDFSPKVTDFSAEGFPLLGGRLDVLNGRTVAALVYGRRKHIINVFVGPPIPGQSVNGRGERQGYRWLAWEAGGFDYIAVSDAGLADLEQLRALIAKE